MLMKSHCWYKREKQKQGLSRMNINIEPNYKPPCYEIDNLSAEFNAGTGTINFNKFYKFKSKSRLVSTCRHELEHAWQYYLDARNTGGRYTWQMKIAKKFGSIKNQKLKNEAEKYTKSIENYVPYYEDYEKYKKNYIEIKANQAGLIEQKNYDHQAQEIQRSFPFIPKEML